MSDSSGNWWLVIVLMWNVLIFVICLVIMIGMFIVLNVIGVVFVIRYSLVVCSGLKLRLMSSVVVIVMGVLKLVVFLRNVLNEKLISSICRCWLLVIDSMDVWMMLNWLVFMMILYRNMVVMMIYVIGYRLYVKLKLVVVSVCGMGILYVRIVMLSDSSSVIVVVMWFFICSVVSVMKKKMIGIVVMNVDSLRLLSGV